jgi:aspartyl-tRNA(Asn)/glutamyl-tRNA(Gln) amidotransferase subunit C
MPDARRPKFETALRQRGGTDGSERKGEPEMKISKDEVLYVANLARLDIDEAAVEKLTGQIGDILDYVDQLKQVDTSGIQPTSHAVPLTNAFREDLEKPHLDREAALANAPQPEDGFFVVPKVVG